MPYGIYKRGDKYCLVNKDSGHTYGYHASKEDAESQRLAIEAGQHRENERHLHLRGTLGEIRTAKYRDREHLVLPVVALVEGVVWPVNAPSPEFAPLGSFSVVPQGWNGRPVFCGHPERDGKQVPGNDPTILPNALGCVFNAKIDKSSLTMEAWIDVAKARELSAGTVLLERLTKIQAGEDVEPIEVSIGAFVLVDAVSGKFKGKSYDKTWSLVIPDHLALLSEGEVGACSVAAGCGCPRAATVHLMTAQGIDWEEAPEVKSEENVPRSSLTAEVLAGLQGALGLSDADVRSALNLALQESMGGKYCYIEAYYPEYVIYSVDMTMAEGDGPGAPGKLSTYQSTYSLDETGKAMIGEDRVEVKPVLSYEPVEITSAKGARHSSSDMKKIQTMHDQAVELGALCQPKALKQRDKCSCQHHEGVQMKSREERIKALIEDPKTVFTDADQEMLKGATDDRLLVFEAAAKGDLIKAIIDKIISNDKLPFTEEDRGWLEDADESRLVEMLDWSGVKTPGQPAEKKEDDKGGADGDKKEEEKPKEEQKTMAGEPIVQTEEQYLAAAPESIRNLVAEKKAEDAARQTELISILKTAQTEFTEDEMKDMPLKEVERLARALKAETPKVNFGGHGAHRTEAPKSAPAPIDMRERIVAMRAKTA